MQTIPALTVTLALAFLAETLTEYFLSGVLEALRMDTRYLRYLAGLTGVGLSLLYGLDALHEFLGLSPRVPFLGEVLTGLILGRGANYVHDFYKGIVGREG